MSSKLKNGFWRPSGKTFYDFAVPKVGILLPHLWIILLVLAMPFFSVTFDYLESVERTGRVAAFVAPSLFSGLLVGYLVLIYVLKHRRI